MYANSLSPGNNKYLNADTADWCKGLIEYSPDLLLYHGTF